MAIIYASQEIIYFIGKRKHMYTNIHIHYLQRKFNNNHGIYLFTN